MNEFSKGLTLILTGREAARHVRRFRQLLATWRLAMPRVKPLVLDFGMGNFAETGLIEYWVANEEEAGYCGKYLFVLDGQTCPSHRHKMKHETFFIVQGKVRMRAGKRSWIMKPGDVFPVLLWTYHSFTGIGPALLLEVSTPCVISDNYFENTAIPIGGNYRSIRRAALLRGNLRGTDAQKRVPPRTE